MNFFFLNRKGGQAEHVFRGCKIYMLGSIQTSSYSCWSCFEQEAGLDDLQKSILSHISLWVSLVHQLFSRNYTKMIPIVFSLGGGGRQKKKKD